MAAPTTEFVSIRGKLSYVWAFEPDTRFEPNWHVTVHPVPEDLEKVRELQAQGVKNHIKKDEDGYNVTFRRRTEMKLRGGNVKGMLAPEVLDGTKPIEGGKFEKLAPDVRIGNGSDGVIGLEVYKHKVPGTERLTKAARLLSIRVDNLVPYTRQNDFDEDQNRAVKPLDRTPAQLF